MASGGTLSKMSFRAISTFQMTTKGNIQLPKPTHNHKDRNKQRDLQTKDPNQPKCPGIPGCKKEQRNNQLQRRHQIKEHRLTDKWKLQATGLTLTDARKYLQNQDEQREIEKRMSRSTNAGHLYNN